MGAEMTEQRSMVVIGGTAGIGKEISRHFAQRGDRVVLSGRDASVAERVAKEVGGDARGVGLDLAAPEEIADRLAGIDHVDGLVLVAIERDSNKVADYNIAGATRLVVLKLVGYAEVVHALHPRMTPDSAIVLFGGIAKDRPYPGSTTVSTVNGGVTGLMHSLVLELAPIRVNAIHPGIIGDSPYWSGSLPAVLEGYRNRTPGGRLATMADVVGAVDFLLENRGVSGMDLEVNLGTLLQ
jgi:NAD(P)-dependent dehydrogenase (short-subunit alcohol dehydrogenase family)